MCKPQGARVRKETRGPARLHAGADRPRVAGTGQRPGRGGTASRGWVGVLDDDLDSVKHVISWI